MTSGYFIYNKSLSTDKFLKLKEAFFSESKNQNIELQFVDNSKSYQMIFDGLFIKKDFVIFWDKDVKLAQILENAGHFVFNNSEAIFNCDDKSKTYMKLLNKNIEQPLTIISPLIFFNSLYKDDEFIDYCIKKLGLPLVIKECFGSFGEQVYLAENKNQIINILQKIGVKPLILQKYIKTSYGRDIRIEVIGNEVVASVYRENKNNDFRANITNGAIAEDFAPNRDQINMALTACKILNLDFAGVDILFGENDKPILCEVNSNAYPLNVQKITGVNIVEKILLYIKNKVS